MPHDNPGRAHASPAEDRLRSENEQLHAEIDHIVESRRAADEALDRYVDLYDHAPLALLTIDDLGIIHDLNLTATNLLGSEGPERPTLLKQRLRRFLVDADQAALEKHLRRCQGATAPISCELRLRRASGAPLVVALWSRRPRFDVRLYPSALVDMTESKHKAAEFQRLVESERTARHASEAKDQFIAILSHELRTPLTPVLAAASALAARTDIDPQLRSMAEMIRRNVVTEARLIDDLLDVNRIAHGKLQLRREVVDLHALVTEAVGMVRDEARAKGVTLMEALKAEPHWALVDPVRMRQVLWNLLRNALKFTPDQGRIEVRSWDHDGRLSIEVSDTGVGFEQGLASRLFQPFEQDQTGVQNSGLGLGLAICKGVVELHGGAISGSSPGRDRGARFVVDLEAVDAPHPASQARPSRASESGVTLLAVRPKGKAPAVRPSILLVEDDPDTGDMLRDLLADAGYQVRIARSARAALADTLDGIDLVLSDLGLPDGSGLDLMRALRARRDLKGIALSGYGTEADVRASHEAGFQAHLTKPVEVSGLLQVIDEVAGTA